MSPQDVRLWPRVPGYDDDTPGQEGAEEEESELAAAAKERLGEITAALGKRWTGSMNFVEFSPPPEPKPNASPSRPPAIPPSQWESKGPPPSFRLEHTCAPVVKETFFANGFTRTRCGDWMVMWSGPRARDSAYRGLHEQQRINHFPGSDQLTRKDRLWANFLKMARRFGSEAFPFVPETFILPRQSSQFLEHYRRTDHQWIVKPQASSQGRGIFLLRNLAELPVKDHFVVSRYVSNPLLIQGLKFDLRIYVLVTSYDPLRAYVYREGLTRFASRPYSNAEEHLDDLYRHLTNYSINKSAENFVENKEMAADNYGHKWSLSALSRHLEQTGFDAELMWSRIMDLILKTLFSVKNIISTKTAEVAGRGQNCFELYGFDVLVDDELKPWLLEVNLSPSMMAESPLDWQVKSLVLSDTFNLVGVCRPTWRQLMSLRVQQRLQQLHQASSEQASGTGGGLKQSVPFPSHVAVGSRTPAKAAAAPAPAAAEEAVARQLPVDLGDLCERQLKALAHALEEVGRCNNFIRLYPTARTVGHYAEMSEFPRRPRHFSMSELLAVTLFGPDAVPLVHDDDDQSSAGSCDPLPAEPSEPCETGATDPDPSPRPPTDAAASAEATPVIARQGGTQREQPEDTLPMRCVVAPVFEANRASAALRKLKQIAPRADTRLVLMEYLARIINVCLALSPAESARLDHTGASRRLADFRKELSLYLRMAAGPHDCAAGLAGWDDPKDELVATCKASLLCLASALSRAPPSPGWSEDGVALEQYLPRHYARSPKGSEAISVLAGLSAAELEWILQGPQCDAEFKSLLTPFAADDHELALRHAGAGASPQNGADLGARGIHQSMLEECWGAPCAALSELLQASARRAASPWHQTGNGATPPGTRRSALPPVAMAPVGLYTKSLAASIGHKPRVHRSWDTLPGRGERFSQLLESSAMSCRGAPAVEPFRRSSGPTRGSSLPALPRAR